MNKVFLKTIDVIFLGCQNYFDSDGSNLFSKYIIKTLIFLTYIKNGALLNKVVLRKTKVHDVTFLSWQNWQHVFKILYIIFNFSPAFKVIVLVLLMIKVFLKTRMYLFSTLANNLLLKLKPP